MKPGEAFEIGCYEFLKESYNKEGLTFHHEGGMDSTKSDIAVIKNGIIDYFIEAKDTNAQSGQFVVQPNEQTKTFVFSPKNHSQPNEMTEIMINYMNQDFDRFNNAGTAGESLDIDPAIFSNWIIEYYKSKNVKYVITYQNNYIILPIRKFAKYFQISAVYRIKKSGSGEPAKKDFSTVINTIAKRYPDAEFSTKGKKLFTTIPSNITQDRFMLGNYTYYLSKQTLDLCEIRRLSNTYNMNIIFSIHLKCLQDPSDLIEFESDL